MTLYHKMRETSDSESAFNEDNWGEGFVSIKGRSFISSDTDGTD